MKPPRPELIKLAQAMAVAAAIEDACADGQHIDDRTIRDLRGLDTRPEEKGGRRLRVPGEALGFTSETRPAEADTAPPAGPTQDRLL
jgi:hypothetical protein